MKIRDWISNLQEGLVLFCNLSGTDPKNAYLIFGGDEKQVRREGNVIGWSWLSELQEER